MDVLLLLMAQLAVLATTANFATTAKPLSGIPVSRRGLFQDPNDPPSSGNATTSSVIEGGISVERCVERSVLGIYSGSFVLPEVFRIVDSRDSCCQLCVGTPDCSAWDFCQSAKGCDLPEPLVKIQSPLQEGGSEVVVTNSESLPYQSCVLTSRILDASDALEDKAFDGNGTQFGFFSATVERRFLPYLSGFKASEGKNVSAEYDFPCGYSPQKDRCEIVGTIPEVAGICSSDLRCRGFVFDGSQMIGVLKGGETVELFTGEEYVDDPTAVVYALAASGAEAQQETPSPSSSSNLWIILISVLGGVAILSIAAVTITMVILSRRCGEIQKCVQMGAEEKESGFAGNGEEYDADAEQEDQVKDAVQRNPSMTTN